MNSIISWLGGKRLLRKHIIPLIPKHNLYCEVFGGAGWVLFGKSDNPQDWTEDKKGKYTEIYNDINGELINFWKYIKYHPEAFVAELNDYLVSRELFEEAKNPYQRTELERAVRFYYMIAVSYGSQSKNFCLMQGHKYLPLKTLEKVKKASARLQNVVIEKTDYEKLILRVDTENTFFYIDPPYYKRENFYKRDDAEAFSGHNKLSELLLDLKGKFILSYNDDPYIKNLYSSKKFILQTVEAPYTISGKNQIQTELLIRNFE